MEKLITVIIATYNASDSIKRCLDSILNEKRSSVEMIIVDGASKDNTVEIIRQYGDQIDKVISAPDRGIYDAWNKGVQMANSRWIMFVGADDTLTAGALDRYLDYLVKENVDQLDYICARNNYLSPEGRKIKEIGKDWDWNEFKKTMTVAHVASLHNKELFDTVGPFDLNFKICADYELLMRKRDLLRVGYVDTVIANMYAGGMSFSVAALKEGFKIRKKYSSLSWVQNECLYHIQLLLFCRFKYFKLR